MSMVLLTSVVFMSSGCGLVSTGNYVCRAFGIALVVVGYSIALALIPSVVIGAPQ